MCISSIFSQCKFATFLCFDPNSINNKLMTFFFKTLLIELRLLKSKYTFHAIQFLIPVKCKLYVHVAHRENDNVDFLSSMKFHSDLLTFNLLYLHILIIFY